MAITGIDTIDGKQIIAAGAISAKSAEMAYKDENGNPITGYQVAGDYYSASNPSGFITGVDLTPYQLTADMTAYQPVGDYMTTADSANFYTTANESGFISEVPAGTMNESAFEYDANDKISGYNGSAFSQGGGGGVPQSAFDELKQSYDALSSLFATYSGQWLLPNEGEEYNTYTAEFAGNAADHMAGSNISDSIELQPNTFNIQYSAHYELGQANRYNCQIGLFKSTEPVAYNYISSASYSAVSEDTKIVDISGTLEIDTSIGYDRFYLLRDANNIFGKVSATITAQYYV